MEGRLSLRHNSALIRQALPVSQALQGFNDSVEAFFCRFAHMPGAHEGMGQGRFFFQNCRNFGSSQLFMKNDAVIKQRVMGGHGNIGGPKARPALRIQSKTFRESSNWAGWRCSGASR